jgi:hypothetical protein
MAPPVQLKLYGLVRVTRRGYLLQLLLAAVLLVGLLVLWFRLPPEDAGADLAAASPALAFLLRLLYHLPWVVLVLGLLFALEAFLVLRRFARVEKEAHGAGGLEPPGEGRGGSRPSAP